MNGELVGDEFGNLFSSTISSEGIAVVTTKDAGRLVGSTSLYLAYYLINITIKFLAVDLSSHPEPQGCFFDRKDYKPDIMQSFTTGSICDTCLQILNNKLGPELVEAVSAMISVFVDEVKYECGPRTLGLALSGGGFRATLFHLGVISYLRKAGYLKDVKQICSVSGGSVLAAHLVLNWDRYTAEDDTEFESAANELKTFTASDVRGQIVRGSPLTAVLGVRNVVGLTQQYESLLTHHKSPALLKHLAGSGRPDLAILATDLDKGRFAAFDAKGLTIFSDDDFTPDITWSDDRITVASAVASSSAFPALFDPVEFEGPAYKHWRARLSDGGILDNLGIRYSYHLLKNNPGLHFLLSDAGRPFVEGEQMKTKMFHWPLLDTAIRSTEIAQWRLGVIEDNSFLSQSRYSKRVTRLKITDTVTSPTRKHPPVPLQAQLPLIRTDFDCFSELLFHALVHHGFCVAQETYNPDGFTSMSPPFEFSYSDSDTQAVEEEASRRVGLFVLPKADTRHGTVKGHGHLPRKGGGLMLAAFMVVLVCAIIALLRRYLR